MAVTRVRIKYRKGADLRFLSHLEVARALDRALIRARLPLAYTEGFKPRPKVSYATSLPVGAFGGSEFIDVSLVDTSVEDALESLREAMPDGLGVVSGEPLPDGSKALQSLSTRQGWLVHLIIAACPPGIEPPGMQRAFDELSALDELEVDRKKGPGVVIAPGKWFDIVSCSPDACEISLIDPGQAAILAGPPLRIQDVIAFVSRTTDLPLTCYSAERSSIQVMTEELPA